MTYWQNTSMDGESIGLHNGSITSGTAGVRYDSSMSESFNASNLTLSTLPPLSSLSSPLYFSLLYQIMASIFGSLIFVIGFVGNVLVIVVVIRTKAMHTPTNCYLLSLAVADIIVLLSATLPSVPEPFFMIDEWPFGRTMCSIIVFLQYLGVNASSLSIGAFTVERYIAICYPMKAQTICTVRRAKRIIVIIWTFLLLYCVPWLALTTIKMKQLKGGKKYETCTFRLKREQYQTYYMIDLVLFYAVPLIVAAILYGLIARILFSSTIPKSVGGAINEGKKDPKRKQSSSRVQVNFVRFRKYEGL